MVGWKVYIHRTVMGTVKVLLEQGEPFCSSLVDSFRFRFIMSGILLAGLVVRNAFKSKNMYKIVMP